MPHRTLIALAATTMLAACGDDDPPRAAGVVERSVPWELRSAEGRRLTLQYEAQACVGQPLTIRPRVLETPSRVRIRLVARREATTRNCAGIVKVDQVRVTLRAPLADRRLVHADVPGERDRESPVRCPAGGDATGRLDARRLVGLRRAAARDLAAEFGCTIRVVVLDGRPLPATRDLRRNRINVALYDGLVVRIESVG